ncbi:cupin domain-containing protein [Streptomyces pseudovenezuelae]|uniref:Quercetin dioxygenase-like cupin family protein n=1 Tax=Streptomyces pseudovenezuelae TaxID=67350 RepID=A0ABT6LKF6_9ACTN|nr:cupin domain-containing protein [Streptomyces pseudovenezuelae]MDH6216773.1 quercetin dioxygenase-like cupin family protein [Streptomyces pseudovenezuelae]
MPVVRPSEALVHEMHGARFISYATPRTGSKELCAWRGEIPPGTKAPAHTVSREEILHVLDGELLVTLDGHATRVTVGDTLIINPGATLAVENPGDRTTVTWVTTSIGLEAELADGTRITPPWTR